MFLVDSSFQHSLFAMCVGSTSLHTCLLLLDMDLFTIHYPNEAEDLLMSMSLSTMSHPWNWSFWNSQRGSRRRKCVYEKYIICFESFISKSPKLISKARSFPKSILNSLNAWNIFRVTFGKNNFGFRFNWITMICLKDTSLTNSCIFADLPKLSIYKNTFFSQSIKMPHLSIQSISSLHLWITSVLFLRIALLSKCLSF